MAFKRARSDENKQIRLTQIKEAATKLFDEVPYNEISLSKIGAEINFSRGNLYKYVSSKEDIYIYIMMDELTKVTKELEEALVESTPLTTQELAYNWAEVIAQNPRYLRLSSLLFSIIEQNASLAILVEFKQLYAKTNQQLLRLLKLNLPEFNEEELGKLTNFVFSFIISIYPVCHPSEIQLEAVKLAGLNFVVPDMIDLFSEGVVLLINGIKLSKI